MEFKCIGTGSSGNCYLVKLGSSVILLDAGVQLSQIVKNVNLNNIDFAFISHSHKDHSASQEKLALRGVPIVDGNTIEQFSKISKFADFKSKLTIYAFPVEHGDCKCAGLIIYKHGDVSGTAPECILYVTDFTICRFDLSPFKFTSVICECNYIKEKVINADDFIRTKENINRHLSLDGCDRFLSHLDLSRCNEIILTHFSEHFSDSIYMGSYINSKYNIKTLCCKKLGGYDIYE